MPIKEYLSRQDYDDDYLNQVWRTGNPIPLPTATVTFSGQTLTPSPSWSSTVRQGGELRISAGPENPVSTVARVLSVVGDIITVDRDPFPSTVEVISKARYAIPEVSCAYLSCVLRQPTYRVMDAMIAALSMQSGQTVAMIGCGMGWEVERLNDLGFTAVGIETSPYIQSMKGIDESSEVNAALIAVGYDPSQGEGLIQRNRMLSQPRTTVPTLLLNEQMSSAQAQRRVRSALGLSGNNRADWALSIGVMETLFDNEAILLNGEMFEVASNVAHYITVLPDVERSIWTQHTAAEWKTLLSPALIVPHGDAASGYVVI